MTRWTGSCLRYSGTASRRAVARQRRRESSTPSSKPLLNFGFRHLLYAVEEPYRRIVEEVAAYVAERGTLEKEKYNELYGR